ncbi:hypothetical protein QTP88_028928 [Uroleucon formosanum]
MKLRVSIDDHGVSVLRHGQHHHRSGESAYCTTRQPTSGAFPLTPRAESYALRRRHSSYGAATGGHTSIYHRDQSKNGSYQNHQSNHPPSVCLQGIAQFELWTTIAISVPMEWDEPVTAAVPLDLTVKKVDNYAVSEVEVEHNGSGKLTEGTQLPPTSPNVAQCATVAVMPLKVQVELPPPPSPQTRCKDYWTPASPSPMMAMEHLAPLHGMYTGTVTYQNLVSSSIVIPEYNPFPSVLPMSMDTQFHQHNHIQNLLQHLKMQQQYLLNFQNHLHLQQQLQLQLHHLCKQKLHLQDSGVSLDPVSMLSCSPVHTATS